MEFSELIKVRHSVRNYTEEQIPQDVLDNLVEQAKLAPSSRNKKPCGFIVVTDREQLKKLSNAKALGSQMIKDSAEYVKELFAIKDKLEVLAVLALGYRK